MNVLRYSALLRMHWMVIGTLATLGALGGAAHAWSQTPIYQATTQLFVSTRSTDSDLGALIQGGNFTQQRVKSYVALATASDVLRPVISELGLHDSPESLAGRVTASSVPDTVLIVVEVSDASPARARDIANAVGRQLTAYVAKLEMANSSNGAVVRVAVTRPAVAPNEPVSPNRVAELILGLTVGLSLGIGVAKLRETADQTIGARHDPGEISGAPVLGTIVDDPQVRTAPLIVHDTFSARAESFRHLRTNIRFLSVDHEIRSLVVTSSVAGEGKTSVASNLAIAVAQNGERVVLVDADLRRPTVAERFELSSGVGLTTVLLGDLPAEEALQCWREDLPLRVLTSGPIPPNPSELLGSKRMANLLQSFVAAGYLVVIDSPPLLPVTDAAVLSRVTDGALVVCRAASTRVEHLRAAVDSLQLSGAPVLGTVLNRVPERLARRGYGHYAYYAGTYTQPYGGRATTGAAKDAAPRQTVVLPEAPSNSASRPKSANGSAEGLDSAADVAFGLLERAPTQVEDAQFSTRSARGTATHIDWPFNG